MYTVTLIVFFWGIHAAYSSQTCPTGLPVITKKKVIRCVNGDYYNSYIKMQSCR